MRIERGRPRRGYVLLVVIAVSLVTVTVLSKLATSALQKTLEAADAEVSLQKRWGTFTLERAVISGAQKRFEFEEERARQRGTLPPPTTIRDAITMGGVTYDLLLGDEDAKLNLNTVYHHAGREKTQSAIESVLGVGGRASIRLIPAVKPQSLSREQVQSTRDNEAEETIPPPPPKAFRSWGEVFDLNRLQQQTGPKALPNATVGLTCWGNGQLNLTRATDPAILAVIDTVMQDAGAKRILKRFRQNPTIPTEVLILTEVSNRRNQEQLKALLSESSNNFSVWINASTKMGKDYQIFSVTERDPEGEQAHSRFAL